MRKLFTEKPRRTPFDQPCNVRWSGIGITPKKEVDMIGLESQFQNGPPMLGCYLSDDLFQTISNRSNEDFAPPLGTPDQVVHHEVYVVSFVLIVHVYSIAWSTTFVKRQAFPHAQAPDRRVPFHPPLKRRGLSGALSCNI
jgi:hypothetical protein